MYRFELVLKIEKGKDELNITVKPALKFPNADTTRRVLSDNGPIEGGSVCSS